MLCNSLLDALKAMEATLKNCSVRTYEHEVRNTFHTIDFGRDTAAIVDMKPVHSEFTGYFDCM